MRASPLKSILGLLAAAGAWAEATGAAEELEERAGLFACDAAAPFEVQGRSSELCGSACLEDISFAVAAGGEHWRVRAVLAAPGPGETRSCAGVLWIHWLGDRATTGCVPFLDEAVALSGRGVVSVLVEAMWAKPHWYRDRALEQDHADGAGRVIALRRALDLLRAQPRVDASRIAVVGHDYGAMYGTLAVALNDRVSTAVLMAPTLSDWAFFVKQPVSMDEYLRPNAPLEIVDWLRAMRGPSLFMQIAGSDEHVPMDRAQACFAAANPPKQRALYPQAGHDLAHPGPIWADRTAWLMQEPGL